MPPKNSTKIPHPQKPKTQSATAAPKTTQAIINLIKFDILCNTKLVYKYPFICTLNQHYNKDLCQLN